MGGGGCGWVRGRCLGRGSTAGVYLATSIRDGVKSVFAVKSVELSRSAQIQGELHILSSLCSPHVVACFGSDVTTEPDGRVFFNLHLEYVPGDDLSAHVKLCGGLDEHAVGVFTRGILKGLAYLHGRGIVHCDVKGQNVLVSEDGMAAKIADLGCAKRVDHGSEARGVISGTPLYMAPEVARGEEQGPEADIWALGCTVIEMATGRPPWGDVQDPVAAIHRIAFTTDVPEFPCNASVLARDFLGKCLIRDPRERWSAEELLDHPFLRSSERQHFPAGWLPETKRKSPRSTLERAFWDSWQEDDSEEDEAAELLESHPVVSARNRLQLLFDAGSSPCQAEANPTWEPEATTWITIRSCENSATADWEDWDEPSTPARPWPAEPELPADYSAIAVASLGSPTLPPHPSVLNSALLDANGSDENGAEIVGDSGNGLVLETQKCINEANRVRTFCRGHERDAWFDLHSRCCKQPRIMVFLRNVMIVPYAVGLSEILPIVFLMFLLGSARIIDSWVLVSG